MPSDLPTVYLAGPIDKVSPEEAQTWSARAKLMLGDDAEAVDPYDRNPKWPADPEGRREMRAWCLEQARECDVVFAGNMDPETVARGSAFELREAEVAGTPIVVQSPEPQDVSHFVGIAADAVYRSLTEAGTHVLGLPRDAAPEAGARE